MANTSPSSRVIITSVGSAVDGVTVAAGEYFAVYVNANSYTLTAVTGGSGSPGISGTASSGSTTGAGSVVVRYLTNNGPDDGLTGYGMGAGLWVHLLGEQHVLYQELYYHQEYGQWMHGVKIL